MQAVILAGGYGKRLQSVVFDRPKPMALIRGKPFLEYQIQFLKKQKFDNIILCVGYKSKQIIEYFQDGSNYSIDLRYSIENELLGTGGAIKNALDQLDDEFFIINGDTLVNVQYDSVTKLHKKRKADVTMVLAKVEEGTRYGSVIMNNDKIISFSEKKETNTAYVNAGIYLIRKNAIDWKSLPKCFSLEKELFPHLVSSLNFIGYKCEGYFIDIGIPEDLRRLENEISSCRWLFKKGFKT